MVAPLSFACFTTGSFSDLSCLLGGGLSGMVGVGPFVSLFVLIVGVIAGYKLKLPLDFFAVWMLALSSVCALAFMPIWVFWLGVLLAAIAAGYGFYKFFTR
jgi:hypothetical protein